MSSIANHLHVTCYFDFLYAANVVVSRKDELSLILDHFNIQVENPVSILTQEASKTFLHSRSGHDKYRVSEKEIMCNTFQKSSAAEDFC